MKKFLALLLAGVMAFSLAACGGSGSGGSSSGGTDETGGAAPAADVAEPGTINVCIASEPDTIDPALNSAVDGATLLIHMFSGLAKWAQDPSGALEIVPDCAEELVEGVENEDGTVTYTYTLREGLTWSDGEPLTAGDFVFAWNRAAGPELAADYGYMFEIVDGYAEMWETDDSGENFVNPDAVLNVEAPDDRTIVVTIENAVPYWNELLAFPTYFPVREDVVANEAWATDPSTYVCNGAYTMASWDHNSLITLEKNESYYDAANVTMDTINFYLSDDSNNMLTNYENGDWQFIDDIPTNEMARVQEQYPDEYVVGGQMGTYYVIWNTATDILPANSGLTGAEAEAAREEIRNAIALLFDRNYIVEEIGQAGQVPASSFVALGLLDANGIDQFYENAGHNDGFVGYYDTSEEAMQSNFDAAIETLSQYYTYDEASGQFTDFPMTLTYLYNTSEGHQAIGEYLQAALAGVGINMQLENQEWATFLNTRKEGNYDIARNGWLGDYNDPISFLDMWTTNSGNNDAQFGRGDHASVQAYSMDLTPYGYDINVENGTWAETYDVLISTIKSCTDNDTRYELMHIAEDLLMQTGCICPLYYYTDPYMINSNIEGFFASPLGYKYFMYCTIA